MINLFEIFLKYAHVSYFHHFTNWNVQFWVLMSLSTMISKISTLSPCDSSLRQLPKKWTICLDYPGFSSMIELRLVTATADSILRLTRFRGAEYELRLIIPAANSSFGGCIRFAAVWSPDGWIQVTTESSSGGWIRVTADSILRLTRVPVAGYKLRPSQVPTAGYKLWLTSFYGWL